MSVGTLLDELGNYTVQDGVLRPSKGEAEERGSRLKAAVTFINEVWSNDDYSSVDLYTRYGPYMSYTIEDLEKQLADFHQSDPNSAERQEALNSIVAALLRIYELQGADRALASPIAQMAVSCASK